jgi:hypothetical protein
MSSSDSSSDIEFEDCEGEIYVPQTKEQLIDINIIGKKIISNDEYDMYNITNYLDFTTLITLWKKNRIPDEKRVKKISIGYVNKIIPTTTLYISQIDDKYILWEGQHRYRALAHLCLKYDNLDFLNDKFNCIIYKNDTEEKMIEKFMNLNKAVPVPFKDPRTDNIIREKAEYIVDNICKKYRNCQSVSPNPNKPNFNKDILLKDIIKFMKVNNMEDIDEKRLVKKIYILNIKLRDNVSKLKIKTESIKYKAINKNCFLFCQEKYFFMDDLYNNNNI